MKTIRLGGRRVLGGLLAFALPFTGAAAAEPSPVLIRDVNVLTRSEARIEPKRDVLVSQGKIARIGAAGSLAPPQGAVVVEGKGRYLMPGLSEMHAHVPPPPQEQNAYDVLLLYVAHGVTTIRGMLGHPWHLQLRERLEKHEVLGPRLFTAGPSFNGNSAPQPERAAQMVREQAKAGYDFLKLHPGLKREVFDAIVSTARQVNITYQGHVSEGVGLLHALDSRQRAIDHLDGYVQALADSKCLQGPTSAGIFGIGVVHCANTDRIPELARRTKAAGTWMVPTAILLEQWAQPPSREELTARPAIRYLPPDTADRWRDQLRNFIGAQGLTPERGKRYVDVTYALIRGMHAEGVPILLGSDAPQVFNIPGDSALSELALYVRAGLSPFEALRTGTVNPAVFFNAADRFGAVKEGLEADLLLIESNPLEDVSAVRKLAGVMVRGRWLPRSEIDQKLEELAARVGGNGR